jgi:hypothetical protein
MTLDLAESIFLLIGFSMIGVLLGARLRLEVH